MLQRKAGVAAVAALAALPGVSEAQALANDLGTQAQSNFVRNEDVAVLERPHPLYDPVGMPLGGFTLYPSLTASSVYDDNIYAEPAATTSDVIVHVQPHLTLNSNWARGYLSLDANASLNRYASHASQDTDDWSFAARGGHDFISSGKVEASASAAQLTEPRSAANSLTSQAAPVVYRLDTANVSAWQERNRFKFTLGGSVQRFDYDNVAAVGGGEINETFRNRTVPTFSGRVDYALSPNFALFGEAIGNIRNYDQADPSTHRSQDASGYELLSGANFQLTHLLRGELSVGYLQESYANAAFGQVSGPGFRNKLEWFPTQLTTVTATLARSVEDSGVLGAPTYRETQSTLRVDHELLRNLILSAQGGYFQSAYVGLPRTDDRYEASAIAHYLFNRRLGLNLQYDHLSQRSSGAAAGTRFEDNKVGLALSLRL